MSKPMLIIPARAGSQRIPKKNTRVLGGKPLVLWSIETAIALQHFCDCCVVVTSDDTEILELSAKAGVTHVIKRDESLATDTASTSDVITDVIGRIADPLSDEVVVLLQPTSPFRNLRDIKKAIEIIEATDCDSVISVAETRDLPWWTFTKNADNVLKPIFESRYFRTRSQDLPKTYIPNGSICATRKSKFLEHRTFYMDRVFPLELGSQHNIDLDTELDWRWAEFLVSEKDSSIWQ